MLVMQTTKKLLMALAALAALAFGGATIANATNNGDGDGETRDDGPDASLVGTTAGDRAGKAATDDLGGGKVVSVEQSDEGGAAAYEVKVDKAGKVTEVQVSRDYAVTAKQADDDQREGDGDGETNDD
jgi:uncharacterized membrane protein YkoI